MKARIEIKLGTLTLQAELNQSKVARKILEVLPIKSRVSTWGEEIYFPIPVKTEISFPVTEVRKGDLGYWPEGTCLCIFFGPTPVSPGEKIIPASAVEIIGRLLLEDWEGLKKVKDGEAVIIEKLAE
ncbi:MAG: cyclophilin-like fold protein [Candidatus Omnitrophica bacterium]|nr:cyclophilin-like fold protein [Candidatus Omnitrophota bacterium]